MVRNLGHQKCPVAVRSCDLERKGADANIAMSCVSVAVTCNLDRPYRGHSHRVTPPLAPTDCYVTLSNAHEGRTVGHIITECLRDNHR